MRRTVQAILPAIILLAAAAGCDSTSSVTGTVTVDGKKLAAGYITFYPVTAQGETKGATAETRGADIVNGGYTITGLSPGKRKAVISIAPRLAIQKDAKSSVRAFPPAQPIAPNAPGNSKHIDIVAGEQNVDFALQKK